MDDSHCHEALPACGKRYKANKCVGKNIMLSDRMTSNTLAKLSNTLIDFLILIFILIAILECLSNRHCTSTSAPYCERKHIIPYYDAQVCRGTKSLNQIY